MATLIDADKVKYLCSCKRLKPLFYLYYCKYCKPFTLKCKDCVLHEIDQKYFCANCFDNKTQKELIPVKFKCSSCFSCPYCKNLLMIRASSVKSKTDPAAASTQPLATSQSSSALATQQSSSSDASTPVASPQTSAPAQKVFYLMCGFCRWTTRDVGIPDVTSAPGGWKLQENPNSKRIQELIEAYKIIAAREKLEKDRKKYPKINRRAFHLTSSTGSAASSSSSLLNSDKYGILAPAHKRLQMGSSNLGQNVDPQIPIDQQLKSLIKQSETVDSFEKLPDEFFTKEFNINSFTSINQRHINPEFQPAKSSELYPLNKYYQSKESKRCTGCEHNVLKPESNITSIKFKLHQMAIFLVPEVRIVTIPEWVLNQPSEVILSVTNRYETDVSIEFVTFEDDQSAKNLSGFKQTATITFDQITENIIIDRQDTSKAQAAALKQSDLDTKGFVCFRRDNKIAVKCKVTPLTNENDVKKEPMNVKCVFGIKCTPVAIENPAGQAQQTQNMTTPHDLFTNSTIMHKIFVDFGRMRAEDGFKVIPTPRYVEECLKAAIK